MITATSIINRLETLKDYHNSGKIFIFKRYGRDILITREVKNVQDS